MLQTEREIAQKEQEGFIALLNYFKENADGYREKGYASKTAVLCFNDEGNIIENFFEGRYESRDYVRSLREQGRGFIRVKILGTSDRENKYREKFYNSPLGWYFLLTR